MSGMRAHIANRLRATSLSAVPPSRQSSAYSGDLAKIAASILYRSPLPSSEGRPVFILNAAALPDSQEADYDNLLPYVLSRLPEEDELLKGFEYEVVFFAGDGDGSVTSRKHRPGWGWFLQAYHVLSRAMRKRLQKLYIVHEKAWVRILTEIFSTIVSPKFRRKIYHLSSLSNLALQIPIENLLIPPSTYLTDRRVSDDIFAPYVTGKRAFGACKAFPTDTNGSTRFPRVLRETTSFLLLNPNIKSEGIFRIPPNSKLRDVLKEAYDRSQKYIIWKDNEVALPVPPYPNAEHQDEILAEVDPKDAYSVFMAAALIKAWYASLRQPIFPTTSYADLRRLHGDSQNVPSLDRLRDLFSPASEWSLLPGTSREIVVRHLLPLLSEVAAQSEHNKMTAENLAVCFAPALLCGPDQLEDAKMSSIIRRIFTQAIDLWSEGLREACGQKDDDFKSLLKLPKDDHDWDDPMDGKKPSNRESLEEQVRGITLQDNEKPLTPPATQPNSGGMPPPLPPRSTPSPRSSTDSTKRKPAPPLQTPPRYSTIISGAPENVAESPVTYAATGDGFASKPNYSDEQSPPLPPRRSPEADNKKSGTSNPILVSASARYPVQENPSNPVSTFPSKFKIPKKKALTPTQIDNAVIARNGLNQPSNTDGAGPGRVQGGFALPGLTGKYHSNTGAKRSASLPSPQIESTSPPTTVVAPSSPEQIHRSSLTTSPNRSPLISSLARQVQPAVPRAVTDRPTFRSASLSIPTPAQKLRAPSPGLRQRMPSFEMPQPQPNVSCPARKMLTVKKLNLKKQSVDDLRRLYEERAGTASALVEAGRLQSRRTS